jgi:hypothetical protein
MTVPVGPVRTKALDHSPFALRCERCSGLSWLFPCASLAPASGAWPGLRRVGRVNMFARLTSRPYRPDRPGARTGCPLPHVCTPPGSTRTPSGVPASTRTASGCCPPTRSTRRPGSRLGWRGSSASRRGRRRPAGRRARTGGSSRATWCSAEDSGLATRRLVRRFWGRASLARQRCEATLDLQTGPACPPAHASDNPRADGADDRTGPSGSRNLRQGVVDAGLCGGEALSAAGKHDGRSCACGSSISSSSVCSRGCGWPAGRSLGKRRRSCCSVTSSVCFNGSRCASQDWPGLTVG